MKKITLLFIIALLLITVHSASFDEFSMEQINIIEQELKGIDSNSKTIVNLNEIINEIREDGTRESLDLIPEIISQINDLDEKDAPISSLDNLYNAGQNLQLILMNYSNTSYTPNTRSRGKISDKISDVFDELKWENIKGKIHEEILNLDVDWDVKLFSLDITDGIGLAAKYKWGLEPSYKDGYFTRIDSYRLEGDIKVGDMIKDAVGGVFPFYMNLKSDNEIIFARHFKEQMKAASAIPYNPLKLPIRAKIAKEMEPGTFVSMPAKLNMVVGASAGYSNVVSVNGNGYYLLSGEFRINFLKVDKDRIRVKLIGMRRKGHGVSGTVSYGFNLFGIKILDKQVNHILGTQLFRIAKNKIKGENFSVDYVFNLADEEACEAYNKFLNANLKFKVLPTTNPIEVDEDLTDSFYSNLVMAENLAQEDTNKKRENKRVQRVFKASNFFEQDNFNIKIGIKVLSFGWGKNYVENRLAFYDEQNRVERFYMPVFNVYNNQNFLFDLFKEKENKNTYLLLNTDEQWNVEKMDTLAFTWNKRDKICYKYEFKNLKEELDRMLGDISESSGIADMKVPRKKVRALTWWMNLVFSRETANNVLTRSFNVDEIWDALYPVFIDYGDEIAFHNNAGHDNDDNIHWYHSGSKYSPSKRRLYLLFKKNNWDYGKFLSVNKFVEKFTDVLRESDYTEKTQKFFKLVKRSFYRDYIVRFIFEYAKVKGTDVDYLLNFSARASGMDNFQTSSGDLKISQELYRAINRIIAQITDSSYDMFDAIQYNQLKGDEE